MKWDNNYCEAKDILKELHLAYDNSFRHSYQDRVYDNGRYHK